MPTHPMTRGDTSPALRYDLIPATVDLTGASVTFSMRGVLDRAQAEIISASPPVVQYNFKRGDTDGTGLYLSGFTVTFATGEVETFPPATTTEPLAVHIAEGARTAAPIVIRHIIGDLAPEPITLSDDVGAALDLTGATVTALITVGETVIEHPLVIHDALLGEAWPDWAALALPAGRYPLRLRVTLPDTPPDIADDLFTLEVVA